MPQTNSNNKISQPLPYLHIPCAGNVAHHDRAEENIQDTEIIVPGVQTPI
jgi:hypothetical protein